MAIPPPPYMSRHRKGKSGTPDTNKGLIADESGSVILPADIKEQSRPLVPPPPDESAPQTVGVAGQRGIPVSEAPQGGGESSYRKVAEARASALAEAKAKAAADAKAATDAKFKAKEEAKTKATADAALAEAAQLKAEADAALAQAQALAAAANAKLNS